MIKYILLFVACLVSSFGMSSAQSNDDTLSVMDTVVTHLNEYLIVPIDLTDKAVDWSWSVISSSDIADGCRGGGTSELPMTNVFYDIDIARLNEHYHYRVTMDEQVIIPCVEFATVPDNVMPQLIDALDDLNRRLHMQFTHHDIRWTWAERQFEDYTMGCGDAMAVDSKYNHRTNGYIIEFQLQGEIWEYRVSADRLVVKLCGIQSRFQ